VPSQRIIDIAQTNLPGEPRVSGSPGGYLTVAQHLGPLKPPEEWEEFYFLPRSLRACVYTNPRPEPNSSKVAGSGTAGVLITT
jgi:hypothetical protein